MFSHSVCQACYFIGDCTFPILTSRYIASRLWNSLPSLNRKVTDITYVCSLYSVVMWKNRSRYRNSFNIRASGNWVCAFQRHQNEPPTSSLLLIWGSKTWKARKIEFLLSHYNHLLQSCSDQKFPAASCSPECLEGNREKSYWDLWRCFCFFFILNWIGLGIH